MRIVTLLSFLLLASCGHARSDGAQLASLATSIGTLKVDAAADTPLVAGSVQYRVYENGDVYYSGDVTYRIVGNLTATLPFGGKTRLAPKTVASATYALGTTLTENKVGLIVSSVTNDVATVAAIIVNKHKVDSSNMKGTLSLRTDAPVVRIAAIDVQGSIFEGTPAEMTLHLRLVD